MDGIGQEEIVPVPFFVVEADEEEENTTPIRPKSVGPAARTRSKQIKPLQKQQKNYNNFRRYWETYRVHQRPHRQALLPHHLSYIIHLHQRKRHQSKNND